MNAGARGALQWRRRLERPFVLGHRGARHAAPENTLAAFQLALDEGADGVELDVRLDRDGDVVVIHDTTLERVTKGNDVRAVASLGRGDLSRVDLGGGEPVPRLADVLRWARERSARVNIELKRDLAARTRLVLEVARLVARDPGARERILFSSFDPLMVAGLARLLPWIPGGWLVEKKRGVPGRSLFARAIGAAAIHPHFSVVRAEAVAPWQKARRPVNVWTVNDPGEARRLDALGVDTIITDFPAKILAALG